MKRTLSMITLAVLTIGLLGSCSKINERLDNLDKRIDGIENEQIATIKGQIDGIESSIADLKQIRSDIGSLKQTAEAHGEDIFALQEADETLGNRINNLEDYLKNVLPTYAEKEWVKATYSTLEQYDSTCTAIAEINVKIGELDTKTAKDIKICVDSMKTWVNEKLDAYYTAAQMDAELAKMKASIDSAKASGKISDTKADSVARELTKTKTAVDTAKSHIRSEYKAAIKTAIDSTEGKLTKALNDAITTVNDKITNLSIRVDALYDEVNILAGEVTALENMIQSVTIVPAYSDGSITADGSILAIDCIISPLSAVSNLAKDDFKILLSEVKTKSMEIDTLSISSFSFDSDTGIITVTSDILEYISNVGDSPFSAALLVRNGISECISNFANVSLSFDSDLGNLIKNAIDGKEYGDTARVTLFKHVEYALDESVDAGLVNLVIDGNGALVTLSDGAQISGMQGLEFYNVNFDCNDDSTARSIIALSSSPDERLNKTKMFPEVTLSTYYDTCAIVIDNCKFSGVKTSFVSQNQKNWCLETLVIKNTVVQLEVANKTCCINFIGANAGSIKDIVIENSTFYNIKENGADGSYFLRYSNKGNAHTSKLWKEPYFDGKASWTMKNNTFVNLTSNKEFAGNYPDATNEKPLNSFLWTGNIFFNTYKIQAVLKLVTTKFTKDDNSICGAAVPEDDKSYATEDTSLGFSVPTTALDLTNPDLKDNFHPSAESYSGQHGFGDPRWL